MLKTRNISKIFGKKVSYGEDHTLIFVPALDLKEFHYVSLIMQFSFFPKIFPHAESTELNIIFHMFSYITG